jgi:thiol-disulfide isomerase/thioredoxin
MKYALALVLIILFIFIICKKTHSPFKPTSTDVVEFHYVPWCRYCHKFKPVWEQAKTEYVMSRFAEIDEDIAKTPGITKYPTVLIRNSSGVVEYRMKYDYNDFAKWLDKFYMK